MRLLGNGRSFGTCRNFGWHHLPHFTSRFDSIDIKTLISADFHASRVLMRGSGTIPASSRSKKE